MAKHARDGGEGERPLAPNIRVKPDVLPAPRVERVALLEAALHVHQVDAMPGHQFDAFCQENAANLKARPSGDNQVTLNLANIQALRDATRAAGHYVVANLGVAMESSIHYISFDAILKGLERAARHIAEAKPVTEHTLRIVIITADATTRKSSFWYTANVAHLLQADFITSAPNLVSLADYADTYGFPLLQAILVDDVAFSGSQMADEMVPFARYETLREHTSHIYILLAGATLRAKDTIRKAAQPMQPTIISGTGFIYTPSVMQCMAGMVGFKVTQSEGESDTAQAEKVLLDRIPLGKQDLWRPLTLNPLHPNIICEHKLADTMSINTDLLVDGIPDAGVGPLVNIGQRVYPDVGSEAFYRSLEWILRGQPMDVRDSLFTFDDLATAYLAMPFRARGAAMTLESVSIPVWQLFPV
jgi:hypothetical protein